MVKAHGLRRDQVGEHGVQVTPVHQKIRHTVTLQYRLSQRKRIGQPAGVVVSRVVAVRLECLGEKFLLQTQRIQHADRVGGLLNTGAEARETPRLLVDAHVHADAAQAGGRGQAPDACSDDGDAGRT